MRMDRQISFGLRRHQPALPILLSLILVLAAFAMVIPAYAGENVPPHASVDRSGDVATNERGMLTLSADLGSVRIQTLPANAPPVVHYTVHIETDAPESVAHALLQRYVLTAKEN